jgi:hypothetical protein
MPAAVWPKIAEPMFSLMLRTDLFLSADTWCGGCLRPIPRARRSKAGRLTYNAFETPFLFKFLLRKWGIFDTAPNVSVPYNKLNAENDHPAA